MKDEENQTCEATPEDLMNSDLKHYDEASSAIHHWSSGVPRAIKYYYTDRPKMEEEIDGLKRLLRIAKCPETLIENPNMVLGELTAEDKTWARDNVIKALS